MTATPQDHKSKTFTFTYEGQTHTIPSFNALPMGAIRRARKCTDEVDQAFTILEIVVGEDSPALVALDKMDSEAFNEWFGSWTQGAPLGESSGSES